MPRLQTLKPRISTVAGRLSLAARIQTDRLRGRAAVERRADYLRLHPLCTACEAGHQVAAAITPDHVIPIWAGGADDLETNGQPLCAEHHDGKTACEARMRGAGGWLATPCTCGLHHDRAGQRG